MLCSDCPRIGGGDIARRDGPTGSDSRETAASNGRDRSRSSAVYHEPRDTAHSSGLFCVRDSVFSIMGETIYGDVGDD